MATLSKGMTEEKLTRIFVHADDLGLRFELTDGGITWESSPGLLHQEIVYSIQTSMDADEARKAGCDCLQVADVDISLPDGRVKRPDVSVWCQRPREEEGFVHAVPEAVIEVVSPGYEDKDLVVGPPIYLRNGVKDVIVFDRAQGEVHHWTPFSYQVVASPAVFELQCGCRVTV